MTKLLWENYIPGSNSLEDAINYLNSFDWNLTLKQSDNIMQLFAGDQLLFNCNNRSEVEAFVLGMAISLAVPPSNIHKEIRKL